MPPYHRPKNYMMDVHVKWDDVALDKGCLIIVVSLTIVVSTRSPMATTRTALWMRSCMFRVFNAAAPPTCPATCMSQGAKEVVRGGKSDSKALFIVLGLEEAQGGRSSQRQT